MRKFLVLLLCVIVLPVAAFAGQVTEAVNKEMKAPVLSGGGVGNLYLMAGAGFMSYYINNPKPIFSSGMSLAVQARLELMSPLFITVGYELADIMATKKYTRIYDYWENTLLDTDIKYSDGYSHFVSAGVGAVIFRYTGGSIYLGAGAVYRGGYYTYDDGLLYTITYLDYTEDGIVARFEEENYSIKRLELSNLGAYATVGFVLAQRYFIEATWNFADMVNNPVNFSIGLKAFFTEAPQQSTFYGE